MAADILLIEDNRDHLELMAYLLRAFGHRPMSVGSGEAGVEAASHGRFDLVISDLMLGGMTGFEVAEHFKGSSALRDIPLVAVSALTSDAVRRKVSAAGFSGLIPKPISPEIFVFELQRFVKADLTRNLPPPAAADSPQPERRIVPQTRGTILVVDDRAPNLDLARCLLEQFGFKVITAGGVAEGLASARRYSPLLILTDVHMGDGDGFDLVKTVRSDPRLQHIPCLVMSATYLEADPRVKELGLDDSNFMLRPVDPEVLLSNIEACLAKWKVGTLCPQS